jgi:hypothetical protein
MMTVLPDLPRGNLLQALNLELTPEQARELQERLIDMVEDPRFPARVPRFVTFLPDVGSSLDIQLRIGSEMFTATDPDRLPEEDRMRSPRTCWARPSPSTICGPPPPTRTPSSGRTCCCR